ncbi:MAG: phage holin family protein [Candidatus Eremiobacteraeota bacterium]|nr:phage holin family protein [Candidatus Eremiobacteraeota bacterium]MBV8338470.1 phage holin family protein [Candidatus Eremiobacteraeota bacterium]MBV8596087.1 phage holin family protein [Candidatus Eremiobacteraeota bacterium]MBV8669884.1 phage holin family protein [Candidatus Eremiobacteraeota bacterium]
MMLQHGDLHEQPIASLLRQLSDQIATLVRKEIELAKVEMTEKAQKIGVGAGLFAGAGIFGLGAFAALTATFIWALIAAGLAPWLSALIVTVVYSIVAGAFVLSGKKQLKRATPPIPEQAIDSVKETVQWAKTQTKSGVR